MPLDLSSLQNATAALSRSLRVLKEREREEELLLETLRAGVIQHFEIAYELSWKLMQRWLRVNGSPEEADLPRTRKELFRAAARHGLIADPLPWFEFAEARNQSSHVYDAEQALEVFEAAQRFLPHAQDALTRLGERND